MIRRFLLSRLRLALVLNFAIPFALLIPTTASAEATLADLLAAENYDAAEVRFDAEREKVSNGDPGFDLNRLYSAASAYIREQDEATTDGGVRYLERWIDARPASPTPHVLLVALYVERAWDSRGGGWAEEVTEEGWAGFLKNLDLAEPVVHTALKLAEKDPKLFAEWLAIGTGKKYPAEDCDRILAQGREYGPHYYSLFSARAHQLLPRWYGEKGDLENFAAWAADETSADFGDGFYALMAPVALERHHPAEFQTVYNFDWPRLRKGFEDLHTKYPEHTYREQLLVYACMYEDRETAAVIFEELDPNKSRDHLPFWNSDIEFVFRRWALEEAPHPSENELVDAVAEKNHANVQNLLASGHNPNIEDWYGARPLDYALAQKDPEMIAILLGGGATPNYVDRTGQRPLNAAVIEGNIDLVRQLLDAGADTNVPGYNGFTPLANAFNNDHMPIARLLLERGAVVDEKALEMDRALTMAATRNDFDTIFELLDLGFDTMASRQMGWNVLHYAAHHGNIDAAERIIERDPTLLLEKNNSGQTPLELAYIYKQSHAVSVIHQMGIIEGYTLDELAPQANKRRTGPQKPQQTHPQLDPALSHMLPKSKAE